MLTTDDIYNFMDRLYELTREMPPLQRVREACDLLEEIERVPQRFVMQWRAAAVADLHYLDGVSLREIGRQADRAFQGTSQWLQRYGPTHYLSLIKDGDQVRAEPFAVDGTRTRAKIRQYRAAGRIVVPAVENLYDPATGGIASGTNLRALWRQLS